ncbi:MAG: adenylate/guanylate cyclase domain-containing protein [Hyphomicrobium sp.]
MRWPSKQLVLTLALLVLACGLRIADPHAVARLRLSVFDTYQRLQPRLAAEGHPVRVIDIDDASLDRLGQWPWPRTRLADIVDRLREAGAATIAFDIVLAEPDRFSANELAQQLRDVPALQPLLEQASLLPSNDSRLAGAFEKASVAVGISGEPAVTGRVLPAPKASYAVAGDDPKIFVPRFSGGTPSLTILSEKAKGIGAVNWLPEHDQIVRRVPLFVSIGGTLYPSLAIEQLRLAEKATTLFVRSSAGSGIEAFGQHAGLDSLRVGEKVLYSDGDGQMWLHFAAFDRAHYISAHELLSGNVDRAELAGRHIIIGSSATGLLDLRATPLDASVPGVEVHAQALEQMLAGGGLVRPSWATGAELMLILGGGALIAWLLQRSQPVTAAAVGAAALLAVAAGSWLAFTGSGVLLDPVYPAITLVMLYMAGSLFNYMKAETERARVRSAFSHYLAPSMVEQLAADPGKLKLGGETREITMLIADVRGFTRLSEGMAADEVIAFVNSVFTPMTDIILDERGTIDKFMGDAVMAFWNAPLYDPTHAPQALRAALRMMSRLDELNQQWAAEAALHGKEPRLVRMGIGVNTGPCSVGNVGSPQRVNYSIIGDPVNTASRLEEATKIFGAPILCGEKTAKLADGFALLEIGVQALRGKDRQERMYAVAGDESSGGSTAFASLKDNHARLLASLARGDAADAGVALELCRRANWPALDRLWAVYAAQIKEGPSQT